jgi:hypothetical protein
MTGQSCALLLVNNEKLENFKFTSCVFNQTFELRANSGPTTSNGAKLGGPVEKMTFFQIAPASEPEKKTISMGHKISSFYAPSSQVFLQDFIVIPTSF